MRDFEFDSVLVLLAHKGRWCWVSWVRELSKWNVLLNNRRKSNYQKSELGEGGICRVFC